MNSSKTVHRPEKASPKLIVICGPTAVGKTDLTVKLALALETVVINADSRQVYHEMQIGTARPTESEMKGVKHYMVGNLSLETDFSAGKFEKQVLEILKSEFQTKNEVILSGGSGLYIKALCEGFDDMPAVDEAIRDELNQQLQTKGLEALLTELKSTDPEYYEQVDIKNPQRVVRALEIIRSTGKPFSHFRSGEPANRPFDIIKIGLERSREELYDQINSRMDRMIDQGLFEEAVSLQSYSSHNALQTVGYQEIFDFMDKKYDREEAIRLLKRNSRRFAKRQMTWFKRDPEITWFHPDDWDLINSYVLKRLDR